MMFGRVVVFTSLLCLLLISCDALTGPAEFRLQISPDSNAVLVGDTIALTATLLHEDGQPVSPLPVIRWTSSDTSVATVLHDGRVVGRNVGTSTITAKGNGATATTQVAVRMLSGCDSPGTTHAGTVNGETWTAARSPHVLEGRINITYRLWIEAGAIVCARPGASLHVRSGRLEAIGRADRRIRFVATDTINGWEGINAGGSSDEPGGEIRLDYVDAEFGGYVSAGYLSVLSIDHSTLRKTGIAASANFSGGTVRNSIVEDALVQLAGGTFEETTVRRGRLELIYSQPGGTITVNGGRIEDSPAVALTIGSIFSYRVPGVNVVKAPLITGTRGGIALMPPDKFFALWPTTAAQAQLLDNVNRNVSLWGTGFGDLSLRAGLAWSLIAIIGGGTISSVNIDPGAAVRFTGLFTVSGQFRAIGTGNQPITIAGACQGPAYFCGVSLNGTATSKLSYVTLNEAYFASGGQNVLALDHIQSNGPILLRSARSTISDAEIHDVDANNANLEGAALVLEADSVVADHVTVRSTRGNVAVRIAGNGVTVSSCQISDNSNDGIVIVAGTVTEIHACTIERNGGVGVNNQTTVIVNAQRNWWGDPLGPTGPSGDGVAGLVDYSNPLTVRPTTFGLTLHQ
jgi:hypothetical protein